MAARAKSKPAKKNQALKDIWPQERDCMMRPDRLKYVRKLIKTDGCVFCEAQKKGVVFDSLILFRTSKVMIMMNKYPYNPGHLMVLPTRHCGDILQLTAEENKNLYMAKIAAMKVLQQKSNCQGINVGLNHGAAAGAGIPDHLHWHIVPRWYGDTNFFPLIAETKAIPQDLEQTYNMLKPIFSELELSL